jgi:hypothetical protein
MTGNKVDVPMLAKDVFLVGLIGGLIVQLVLCFILGLSLNWGINEYLASTIIGVIIFGFHINNIRDVFMIHHENSFVSLAFKLCSVLILIIFLSAYNNYLFGLGIIDFLITIGPN